MKKMIMKVWRHSWLVLEILEETNLMVLAVEYPVGKSLKTDMQTNDISTFANCVMCAHRYWMICSRQASTYLWGEFYRHRLYYQHWIILLLSLMILSIPYELQKSTPRTSCSCTVPQERVATDAFLAIPGQDITVDSSATFMDQSRLNEIQHT